jgi:hypothetical protein
VANFSSEVIGWLDRFSIAGNLISLDKRKCRCVAQRWVAPNAKVVLTGNTEIAAPVSAAMLSAALSLLARLTRSVVESHHLTLSFGHRGSWAVSGRTGKFLSSLPTPVRRR